MDENAIRAGWKVGSTCEIYSNSKKKWFVGEVAAIFDEEDGEWLKVRYDKSMRRTTEIQRYSHDIRAHPDDLKKKQNSTEREERRRGRTVNKEERNYYSAKSTSRSRSRHRRGYGHGDDGKSDGKSRRDDGKSDGMDNRGRRVRKRDNDHGDDRSVHKRDNDIRGDDKMNGDDHKLCRDNGDKFNFLGFHKLNDRSRFDDSNGNALDLYSQLNVHKPPPPKLELSNYLKDVMKERKEKKVIERPKARSPLKKVVINSPFAHLRVNTINGTIGGRKNIVNQNKYYHTSSDNGGGKTHLTLTKRPTQRFNELVQKMNEPQLLLTVVICAIAYRQTFDFQSILVWIDECDALEPKKQICRETFGKSCRAGRGWDVLGRIRRIVVDNENCIQDMHKRLQEVHNVLEQEMGCATVTDIVWRVGKKEVRNWQDIEILIAAVIYGLDNSCIDVIFTLTLPDLQMKCANIFDELREIIRARNLNNNQSIDCTEFVKFFVEAVTGINQNYNNNDNNNNNNKKR